MCRWVGQVAGVGGIGVLRVATLRWVNIPHRDSQFHNNCAADVVTEWVERQGRQTIEVDS